MVKINALRKPVEVITILSLVIGLISANPLNLPGSWAQAKDMAPPKFPLSSSWPEVLTCHTVNLPLSEYRKDIPDAEFLGRIKGIPQWKMTHKAKAGKSTMQASVYFSAEFGLLIYGSKADYEVFDEKSGLSMMTAGVSRQHQVGSFIDMYRNAKPKHVPIV